MDWTNLYKNAKGSWLRGNLHTHSGEGMTQEEILGRYAELGYDFLCISDHMKLTIPRPPKGNKLLILPGFEWNSKTGEHMNLISFQKKALLASVRSQDQKLVLGQLAKKPVLVVLNHPNWREPPHYSREELFERSTAANGVEIYNGLIDFGAGTALATEKWDYLLSRRRLVLGFANDDAHSLKHIGNAWIMVRSAARTPQAVFKAVQQGNFYCSTGATFQSFKRTGMKVEIVSKDAQEIWAVGEWGTRLQRVSANRMTFDFEACQSSYARYVRFVAFGKGAAMAWSQPFLKESPVEDFRLSPYVMNWKISRLLPGTLGDIAAPRLDDASLKWSPISALPAPEGFVNASSVHGSQEGICLLGMRLAVARAGRWNVRLGHDGGARLFVDGRLVIDQPKRVNPANPDRSQAEVSLPAGMHEVVVALHTDHGKGQGIFLRFMNPSRTKAGAGGFPEPVK